MTCIHETRIGDLVDETLDAAERAALDAHVATCAGCRHLADDFRAIRAVAATLEQQLPSPQAWGRIQSAIEQEAARSIWSPWSRAWWHARFQLRHVMAPLATAGFTVLTAALVWSTWLPGDRGGAVQAGIARSAGADTADSTAPVTADLTAAEAQYQQAIDGLEAITTLRTTALDPQMTATLAMNLAVIDQAIDESRMALESQPASEVAQASLFDALRSKVTLLEDTVSLINDVGDGDLDAARIESGSNQ